MERKKEEESSPVRAEKEFLFERPAEGPEGVEALQAGWGACATPAQAKRERGSGLGFRGLRLGPAPLWRRAVPRAFPGSLAGPAPHAPLRPSRSRRPTKGTGTHNHALRQPAHLGDPINIQAPRPQPVLPKGANTRCSPGGRRSSRGGVIDLRQRPAGRGGAGASASPAAGRLGRSLGRALGPPDLPGSWASWSRAAAAAARNLSRRRGGAKQSIAPNREVRGLIEQYSGPASDCPTRARDVPAGEGARARRFARRLRGGRWRRRRLFRLPDGGVPVRSLATPFPKAHDRRTETRWHGYTVEVRALEKVASTGRRGTEQGRRCAQDAATGGQKGGPGARVARLPARLSASHRRLMHSGRKTQAKVNFVGVLRGAVQRPAGSAVAAARKAGAEEARARTCFVPGLGAVRGRVVAGSLWIRIASIAAVELVATWIASVALLLRRCASVASGGLECSNLRLPPARSSAPAHARLDHRRSVLRPALPGIRPCAPALSTPPTPTHLTKDAPQTTRPAAGRLPLPPCLKPGSRPRLRPPPAPPRPANKITTAPHHPGQPAPRPAPQAYPDYFHGQRSAGRVTRRSSRPCAGQGGWMGLGPWPWSWGRRAGRARLSHPRGREVECPA